ncbi:t-SNARE [Neocallimastix lanati (nom. inval.)]|jgi:t-SNARE complex subunit (syntaxin)|uniref:t-SNARE n=1 Tax=Neocallimastix californiae TaxID=1754190 RepID=A0A1Y2BZ72_9FUNG|nr:t-SNARE [Neocallimastix sp. JGI-2020a]ORY40061.1 t-SNARE [Neocallimastix californiae]|eukprot:ORY40061.1 t-SNARE [Neocallimastix californiae]
MNRDRLNDLNSTTNRNNYANSSRNNYTNSPHNNYVDRPRYYGQQHNNESSYSPRNNNNNNNNNNRYDQQNNHNNYSSNSNNNYSSENSRYRNKENTSGNLSDRVNSINVDIKELENLIDRLESLYNKSYNEVRINENSENKKRISELEERITGEIQEVTNQLKSIKNEAVRMTSPTDRKVVLNQVTNTSKRLREVFNSYNDKKKNFAEQKRNRMIRQYQIIHQDATKEEAERYADSNPGGTLQYSMLSGSKAAYDEATRTREQMEQINKSINELCDLFQDMNYMLTTQNETIEIIEDNIDTAEVHVDEASKELIKTVEIRKSSRKKLWMITGIIAVVLLILILFLYPKIKAFFDMFKSDEQEQTQEQQEQQYQQY